MITLQTVPLFSSIRLIKTPLSLQYFCNSIKAVDDWYLLTNHLSPMLLTAFFSSLLTQSATLKSMLILYDPPLVISVIDIDFPSSVT
ncbi:hypothetical protein LguiB_020786 [Lonicera macranthoides]